VTRWTILALVLVCLAITAVVTSSVSRARQDRAALLSAFGEVRLRQLEAASRKVEEDLADIGADLRFAGQFALTTTPIEERARELAALLAVARPYELIAVFDHSGRQILRVRDPLTLTKLDPSPYEEAMRSAAERAMAGSPSQIVIEPAGPDLATSWLRVFALAVPHPVPESPGGAVALLVDTESLFDKLNVVAADPDSALLLLSPSGSPAPLTSPAVARAAAALLPGGGAGAPLGPLSVALRRGESGNTPLSESQARALGLPPGGHLAAYTAIRLRNGRHWAVASFTSTAVLRAHERSATVRMVVTTGAITLFLLAFGAYVVLATRRAAALRERVRHADQLAHLHEKTEKILDNVPAGVMALAEDGHITALNRSLRERVPEKAMGAPLGAAFPEAPAATVERLEALVETARTQDRPQSLLGETVGLFGEEGRYNIHVVPLERGLPEARFLLVLEDLTEVRSLESQLLRAEKLATVGVLAAGIAHEIGTPLGVVRGRAEYVSNKLGGGHPQSASLQVIVDQIDHVARTIRQLLDFARVKPAAVRPVAVPPVVTAVLDLLRLEAARRKLTLGAALSADLPLLAADPDQLQQVLVNLVMNACDACSPGGHVTISAAPAETGDVTGWRRVRLEVADDGYGIAPELQHQVFDPFFTTKKRGQGTGLGLSIAAQIVRNHGGEIELDSEAGRGTRVSVLWPVASAGSEEQHATG
jgi:two-component system sensor histidine kinase HydH